MHKKKRITLSLSDTDITTLKNILETCGFQDNSKGEIINPNNITSLFHGIESFNFTKNGENGFPILLSAPKWLMKLFISGKVVNPAKANKVQAMFSSSMRKAVPSFWRVTRVHFKKHLI